MANEETKKEVTKKCKHCQSDIPKKAKVCPVCKRKQGGGCLTVVGGVIIFILIIAAIAGGSGGNEDSKVKKTGENAESGDSSSEETVSNVFKVGDIVETKYFKITYVSSSQYTPENEYLKPKDGYEYWEFEFKFENISDSDKTVSSFMDWTCYADNSKVDQSYVGDDSGLDATLSSGRTTQGKVYFEVPTDAESIELEYDINFWQSDKIVFVGK